MTPGSAQASRESKSSSSHCDARREFSRDIDSDTGSFLDRCRRGTLFACGRSWRLRQGYPHPRGESFKGQVIAGIAGGSPPPAWGKRQTVGLVLLFLRFTPTRVGKARYVNGEDAGLEVHPHPRGESGRIEGSRRVRHGSPPPAWGKLLAWGCHGFDDRFTPTRVGKATSSGAFLARPTVHPHPRGESDFPGVIRNLYLGSPPPAWGKPAGNASGPERVRFTPTRVGKAMLGPGRL